MASLQESLHPILPDDHAEAALAGLVWLPDVDGPAVVTIE